MTYNSLYRCHKCFAIFVKKNIIRKNLKILPLRDFKNMVGNFKNIAIIND